MPRAPISIVPGLAVRPEYGWTRHVGALPKVMASQATWQIATWCLEIHAATAT